MLSNAAISNKLVKIGMTVICYIIMKCLVEDPLHYEYSKNGSFFWNYLKDYSTEK